MVASSVAMGREEPRLDNDNKNQGHDQTTELKYLLSLQKTKKKKERVNLQTEVKLLSTIYNT